LEYLRIFFNKDIDILKKQIKMNIFGSILLLVIFLITLISTFTFLQNINLNLIPLFSLFIVSISIILLIVNIIRYNVLKKVEKGEFIIDQDFLKLYILKKYFEKKEILKKNELFKKPEYVKLNSIGLDNKNNLFFDFIEETDISNYMRNDYEGMKKHIGK
jgi:hypothetical protein